MPRRPSYARSLLVGALLCIACVANADPSEPPAAPPDAADPEAVNREAFEEISADAPPTKSQERTQAREAKESEEQGEAPPEPERKWEFDIGVADVWWDQGIRIEGVFQNLEAKIGARLMGDAVYIDGSPGIDRDFETGWLGGVRQARVDITGAAGERIYFRIQVDVTGESSTDLSRSEYIKYAYLGVTKLGWLGRAEMGILKEPISMGVLTSGLNLDFMERGLPTIFAPSYNVGIAFRNEVLDESISWAFGLFRGEGEDGDQSALDIAARIGTVVLRAPDDRHFLHIGANYKYETGDFEVRYRARPETHWGEHWIDTGKIQADSSHLAGLELAGIFRAISFQSEVIASWVQRDSGRDVAFWGYYAQVSYFLTGEHRNYQTLQRVFGRVQLNHEFSWARKTWGAFELAARYSYLDLDDHDVRGGQLRDLTLGANWYILSNLRLMANYIHARRAGGGHGNLYSMRFQIDF